MGHATLLRRLLPPASYDPNGTRIAVPLGMEGAELDRVLADAPHAVGALRPFTYQEWLEDYERVYGLPDACLQDGSFYQDRLGFIALALRERAGISIGWLVQYATLAGYDVTISEFSPFVAGSRAGDALTNGAWLYAFTVHAAGEIARRFCAGRSVAGEPLAHWGEGPLECIINKYKPAHAVALFAYGARGGFNASHRHFNGNF